jgi:hypothetical protein
MLKDLRRPIWNEIREMIARLKPDMVGISLRTAAFGSALTLAEEYNRSQKRRLLIDHPFYVAGRVIWGKYYYPNRLWTLAGHLVGRGTHPETPAGKEFFDHSGRGHAAHSRSNRVATH